MKIALGLAAIAVSLALPATAAASPKLDGPGSQIYLADTQSVQMADQTGPSNGGGNVPGRGSSNVYAKDVAATGDGASQETCDKYKFLYDLTRQEVSDLIDAGDADGAVAASYDSDRIEDQALDAGCFIIH